MNRSLHLYLNDLVGNAQQLIITADNARIPAMDSSRYMDTSSSSTGSSSRWDSEAGRIENTKEKKSQTPRLPPRRQHSASPPSSPVSDAPRVRHCQKSQPKSFDGDDNDENDCCRRRSASDSICLADALRMPQRRPSSTNKGSKSRRSGEQKHRCPRTTRREKRGDDQSSNRHVSHILDEAIRELRIERAREMPPMQACS